MTRHLLDIGERNRDKEAGFGLIGQHRDNMDLRKHLAYLTRRVFAFSVGFMPEP
jgi:hypothetical protein